MTTHRKHQVRKPSWWIVLADDKSNRVVVPPTKITDVPLSDPSVDRNYRPFKVQFQGPPNTGLFTWRVYIISDTFVGEEVSADITVHLSAFAFMGYILSCFCFSSRSRIRQLLKNLKQRMKSPILMRIHWLGKWLP